MISGLPEASATAPAGSSARERMLGTLRAWAENGWLRAVDAAFAGFLWREAPDAPPLLILAAALASHQLGRGHVCLDLAATLADPTLALSLPPEGAEPSDAVELPGQVLLGVQLRQWLEALGDSRLVGDGVGATPLVLVAQRLYLRRYWQYEQDVRGGVLQRLQAAAAPATALPVDALRKALAALFPKVAEADAAEAAEADWQKLACALAARSAFSVITGGPGTGKTTTVVKLLALLQALALADAPASGRPARALRIRLAAPTGKAAARLSESIAGALARLPLAELGNGEAIRAAIPVAVSTLHRLLGSRPDSRLFRHHAGQPLALDVLVIDEASMVDLEMMAAVLAALPARARLILLGDKDQLASVEAGAVLGELCRRAGEGHYTPQTSAWLASVCGQTIDPQLLDEAGSALDQTVAMLRFSHRFATGSGIGRLAAAVNAGDFAAVQGVWRTPAADLAMFSPGAGNAAAFNDLVIDGRLPLATSGEGVSGGGRAGYRHYLETLHRQRPAASAGQPAFDNWARQVLRAHSEFQVLCALRRGPWGIDGLNQRIAQALHAAGLIPATQDWYAGRPVLVTRNDYALGLMNGDIGITLAVPVPTSDAASGEWVARVAFPAGDGSDAIKWVLPSRLQAVETVYALTVHKSQGSEFTHTALVLPEKPNPILTRELLYTGITRARRWFTLLNPGGDDVQRVAVERRVLRASGLLE